MTVTSRAAGWPLCQLGRKMSAGRLRVPGIKDGTSFLGAKAADWAAENTASRIESCRRILSPLPSHKLHDVVKGKNHMVCACMHKNVNLVCMHTPRTHLMKTKRSKSHVTVPYDSGL